jgi:hypothetical protein
MAKSYPNQSRAEIILCDAQSEGQGTHIIDLPYSTNDRPTLASIKVIDIS